MQRCLFLAFSSKLTVMANFVLSKSLSKIYRIYCNTAVINSRNISYADNGHRVVSSADGKVVVCWHPETEFPYEKSLPINRNAAKSSLTALKVQNLKEVLSIFNPKKEEFVRQELMDITYTTKHRWFPENIHKRRRKRHIEESRPYL